MPDEPQTWGVFDPCGAWLGTVEVPHNLDIQGIGLDYVLGVVTDDLGVERVEMYRLQRT